VEAQESELRVASPTELEEPQQLDAVQCVPESPTIGHPELEQKTDVRQ
jgi:hypothetical protein